MIEVGEDDTTETMRQKVASAAGLREDSFQMGFGGKDEGEDITQLSDGDSVVLTKTPKYEAIAALHALGETDITAATLEQVEDPKVASLLLQAEVATAIPDDFFLNTNVTRIAFSCMSDVDDDCGLTLHLPALPCVTAIGDMFASQCAELATADFSGLKSLTTIGDCFLSYDTSLSAVVLTGLHSLTSVGTYFANSCTSLSTVDLTGLKSLTTIGDFFLAHCTSLSTIDLTGLKSLTTIGDCFLYNCLALSTVDFTSLHAVTAIGSDFLAHCASLLTVDLTNLQALTTVGDSLLSNCTTLSTVDLTGLHAVTAIGSDFLINCGSLQTVHGKDNCSNVVRSRVDEVSGE